MSGRPHPLGADDGVRVIRPDDVAALEAGRWLLLGSGPPPTISAYLTREDIEDIEDPASDQLAVLREDGYSGFFVFDDGDFSTEVTADPGQINYIAPASDPTGNSGAWIRVTDSTAATDGISVVTTPLSLTTYDMPSGFNDQLGNTRAVYDGSGWRFTRSRYDVLDFTRWADPADITHWYQDYATGNDADDGLSEANAKKTWDDLVADILAAHTAGDMIVIHLLGDYLGTLAMTAKSYTQFDGLHVKVIGEGPQGFSVMLNMREDKLMAGWNWAAHGSDGAWKSNQATYAGNYPLQFFLGERDDEGRIPCPIVSTGQSAASVETDELTSHWDGTYLYVHLPNGAKPNPFVNWIYSNNSASLQIRSDSGTVLFEHVDFFHGTRGAAGDSLRTRSVTDSNFLSDARLGLKDCYFYGATGNGLGTRDWAVVVREECGAAYCRNDLFNDHANQTTGDKGEYITVYEDRCSGHDAGYAGFADGLTSSNSENGSTVHDGISIVRAGCRYWNNKDAPIADVGGGDSINYGPQVGPNLTGASSFYPAAFVYEANTGEGTGRRMILIGASASDDGEAYSILQTGTAADATIYVAEWQGSITARLSGRIKTWPDGADIQVS